jgi:uncharacterized protein
MLQAREYHAFEGAGQPYVYLVPSAGVFRLDDVSQAILGELASGPRDETDIIAALGARFAPDSVRESISELRGVNAVGDVKPYQAPVAPKPPRNLPIATVVMNVTSKCNLACKYCYEYGEDKIIDVKSPATWQPPFMSEETARQTVEFALKESANSKQVHLTFFGGETLLNFKVLQSTVSYARQRAAEVGKEMDFSLTTNATLLRPETIDWLVENNVAVTVSIDGPRNKQDDVRVFKNGKGSYDVAVPKIRELLQRHRTRPIGARVTLTRHNLDVRAIYDHLTQEIGFRDVGFAPVTTSPGRDWAIVDEGYSQMLSQFESLAWDFLECAVKGEHHGFTNIREELGELHKGSSKAFPCGAGIGLVGVATDGDLALCHRFAGSPEHELGSVHTGIDRDKQVSFLEKHHVASPTKSVCHTCWARPMCAGGCYHEAHTRYGTTGQPNLHYCDWIRRWIDTCLRVYGELSERNPAYLTRLAA